MNIRLTALVCAAALSWAGGVRAEGEQAEVISADGQTVREVPVLGSRESAVVPKSFVRLGAKPAKKSGMPQWTTGLEIRDADWDDFNRDLARHAKGRLKYYEIVNEPNLQVGKLGLTVLIR